MWTTDPIHSTSPITVWKQVFTSHIRVSSIIKRLGSPCSQRLLTFKTLPLVYFGVSREILMIFQGFFHLEDSNCTGPRWISPQFLPAVIWLSASQYCLIIFEDALISHLPLWLIIASSALSLPQVAVVNECTCVGGKQKWKMEAFPLGEVPVSEFHHVTSMGPREWYSYSELQSVKWHFQHFQHFLK